MKFLKVSFNCFPPNSGDLASIKLDSKIGEIIVLRIEFAEILRCVKEALQNTESSLRMRLNIG